MRRAIAVVVLVAAVFVADGMGQALSADEQAFFDKHVKEVVKVEPVRLNDAAVVAVFAPAIYQLNVTVETGEGQLGQRTIVARVGDELVPLARPGSDGDFPAIQKLFRPDFKLTSNAAATTLQKALDAVFPIIGSSDKEAATFRRTGRDWTFVRGKFFDDQMGFVFGVAPSGAISSVKYVLKLPRQGPTPAAK